MTAPEPLDLAAIEARLASLNHSPEVGEYALDVIDPLIAEVKRLRIENAELRAYMDDPIGGRR